MRISQFLLPTLKEIPADAEIISHQLMLRAGMIRKLSTGIYSWLPLGLRVLKKVEHIVREEMNRAGALEILLPAVQPAELWQETERWEEYGGELLKIKDRNKRDFCFGPTHEEVITDLIRRELKSYKQLPLNCYQIQTKFRDEIRPRFGIMRAREFLMKDAYSFHLDKASLEQTYQTMYETYTRIFTRLGLDFRAVLADTGSIGGNASHEFQVLAKSGEDVIAISDSSDYAANVELAEAFTPEKKIHDSSNSMEKIATPGQQTINSISEFLQVDKTQTIKTLIVHGNESLVALALRGDHELNPIKAEKLTAIAKPLTLATEQEIQTLLGCKPGYIGPISLPIPLIIDRDAAVLVDFVCGANEDNMHMRFVNWERDAARGEVADLRKVVPGDKSPDGKGKLKLVRGIEVGHIFQLGSKYSKAMNATVLNEQGQEVILEMGCYGIGISRIVAAAIEQNHDDHGIIWPAAIAPFHVILIPINWHKSTELQTTVEALYRELQTAGLEVLLDDRNERAGVMFADADLIGIPHRLILSERGLTSGFVEYKSRSESESRQLALGEVVEFLLSHTVPKT